MDVLEHTFEGALQFEPPLIILVCTNSINTQSRRGLYSSIHFFEKIFTQVQRGCGKLASHSFIYAFSSYGTTFLYTISNDLSTLHIPSTIHITVSTHISHTGRHNIKSCALV